MLTKRFAKVYVEITNVCNLNCSFCKGTDRKKEFMSVSDFEMYAKKLVPYTDYLYLHVLGEPLLHPNLREILAVCKDLGFKAVITTNGTLLSKTKDILLDCGCLYKITVSVHSKAANCDGVFPDNYLGVCSDFCKMASENGTVSVLRLWNLEKGKAKDAQSEKLNLDAESYLRKKYKNGEWKNTPKGIKIDGLFYLEYGEKFSWREPCENDKVRCMGMRDQIGVLVDGTVIPCCIDCDGVLALGNLGTDSVEDIINSKKAKKLRDGFLNGYAEFKYCRKCGFARAKL